MATKEILPLKGMSRGEIQAEIKKKERALDALARQYVPLIYDSNL